jgi:hypothetical protein
MMKEGVGCLGPMRMKNPDERDFRYRENRVKGYNKDGTLDLRCKENRNNKKY